MTLTTTLSLVGKMNNIQLHVEALHNKTHAIVD